MNESSSEKEVQMEVIRDVIQLMHIEIENLQLLAEIQQQKNSNFKRNLKHLGNILILNFFTILAMGIIIL